MSDLSDDPTEEEIEAYLEAADFTCKLCGRDSHGEAAINDDYYCHNDERSCYMEASHVGSLARINDRLAGIIATQAEGSPDNPLATPMPPAFGGEETP